MCFAKVIIINNQLKYVVYRISSVWWLHIYPVLFGVCVCVCVCIVHCAESYSYVDSTTICFLKYLRNV